MMDIDGVLTDGLVRLTEDMTEAKQLSYRDIDAVFEAKRMGLVLGLVTGERSPMVGVVARRLDIDSVYADSKKKEAALTDFCSSSGVPLHEVCYIGDSDRDAPALEMVGLGLAPGNATSVAKHAARQVLETNGGHGAIAEALDIIRAFNLRPQQTVTLDPDSAWAEAPVVASLRESIAVKQEMLAALVSEVAEAAHWLVETFQADRKVLLFGNGGSASDAQHMAAELVGRFESPNRRALPAIALSSNVPSLTAIANDISFDSVFGRQVEALGQPGDLIMAFSTSGNSPNVIRGIEAGKSRGLRIIGLTGASGGNMAAHCELLLNVPSRRTARVQECHIAICHSLCDALEQALAGQ